MKLEITKYSEKQLRLFFSAKPVGQLEYHVSTFQLCFHLISESFHNAILLKVI